MGFKSIEVYNMGGRAHELGRSPKAVGHPGFMLRGIARYLS